MKIACPSCKAVYEMDASRMPPGGVAIKCPKCSTSFRVSPPPGAGAGPRPAAPPAGPPPGARVAVPLPPPAGAPLGAPAPTNLNAVPLPAPSAAAPAPPPPAGDGLGHPPPPFSPPPGPPPGARAAAPPAAPEPSAFDALDFGNLNLGSATPPAPPPSPPPAAPPVGGLGANAFGAPPPAPGGGRFDLPPPAPPPPGRFDAAASSGGRFDPPSSGGGRFDAPPPAAGKPPDDLEMLDFVDEGTQAKGGKAPLRYTVRRKSGKTFGPFDATVVMSMLEQGQLLGNEEISTDGKTWAPITSHPAFAGAAAKATVAPPVMPVTGKNVVFSAEGMEVAPKGTITDTGPAKVRAPRRIPWGTIRRAGIPAGLVVLFLVVGLVVGTFTPYGFFGYKLVYDPSKSPDSNLARQIAEAKALLRTDSRADYGRALELAAAAMQEDEDDERAQGLFVQAVYALERLYGTTPDNLARAEQIINTLEEEKEPEVIRARAARALVHGGHEQARAALSLLQSKTPEDLETAALLAASYLKSRDGSSALKALASALAVKPDDGKLLYLRGQAHRLLQKLDDAASDFAVAATQGHASSLVALAEIQAALGRRAEAEAALERALSPEIQPQLSARDEARARLVRASLLVMTRKYADAGAEYAAAVKRDPGSAEAHGAYGRFLLGRREYAKAATEFQAARKLDASNVDYADGLGRALIAAGQLVDATRELDAALKTFAQNPRLLYLMGRIAAGAGKMDEAVRQWTAASQADPAYVEPRLALGRHALDAQTDRASALALLKEAAERAPQSAEAQAALGDYHLLVGAPDAATERYAAALALDADNLTAHHGLARAHAQAGRLEDARSEFEVAVRLDERDPALLDGYGMLLWRMGDLDGATAALARAVKADPLRGHKYLTHYGAVLVEKSEYDTAREQLDAAVAVNDAYAEAHYWLGQMHARKGEYAQAVDRYKRAIERDRTNARYHYELGLVLENTKQLGDALVAFKQAVSLEPGFLDAQEHLARMHMAQNQFVAARDLLVEVLKKDPSRTRLLGDIGDCYVRTNQFDQAIKQYTEALKSDPKLVGIYYKLGRAWDAKERRDKAADFYLKAVKNEPDNPFPHYYLGFIYKDRGQKKEAIRSFKEYLRLKPDAEDAQEIKDQIYYLGGGDQE